MTIVGVIASLRFPVFVVIHSNISIARAIDRREIPAVGGCRGNLLFCNRFLRGFSAFLAAVVEFVTLHIASSTGQAVKNVLRNMISRVCFAVALCHRLFIDADRVLCMFVVCCLSTVFFFLFFGRGAQSAVSLSLFSFGLGLPGRLPVPNSVGKTTLGQSPRCGSV